MEQLEDNLGALQVVLPDEHLRTIDTLAPPGTDLAGEHAAAYLGRPTPGSRTS
jgi:hypothetical protein